MDAEKFRRDKISIILDPDVTDAIERAVGRERSTVSAVCRRVLTEWAVRQRQGEGLAA
jgi:hypothetical protein